MQEQLEKVKRLQEVNAENARLRAALAQASPEALAVALTPQQAPLLDAFQGPRNLDAAFTLASDYSTFESPAMAEEAGLTDNSQSAFDQSAQGATVVYQGDSAAGDDDERLAVLQDNNADSPGTAFNPQEVWAKASSVPYTAAPSFSLDSRSGSGIPERPPSATSSRAAAVSPETSGAQHAAASSRAMANGQHLQRSAARSVMRSSTPVSPETLSPVPVQPTPLPVAALWQDAERSPPHTAASAAAVEAQRLLSMVSAEVSAVHMRTAAEPSAHQHDLLADVTPAGAESLSSFAPQPSCLRHMAVATPGASEQDYQKVEASAEESPAREDQRISQADRIDDHSPSQGMASAGRQLLVTPGVSARLQAIGAASTARTGGERGLVARLRAQLDRLSGSRYIGLPATPTSLADDRRVMFLRAIDRLEVLNCQSLMSSAIPMEAHLGVETN